MTTFTRADDLADAEFVGVNLRGARIIGSDVSGLVMRGVELSGVELDSPWLTEGDGLVVNGVDVVAFVEAELDQRFPGRALRRAQSAADLLAAFEPLWQAWDAAIARAATMPEGTVDRSVAGEWSFTETLRHLLLATDLWFRRTVLRIEQPFHPAGLVGAGAEEEGFDMSVFSTEEPAYAEVLAARAERVAEIRDYLGSVTEEQLAEERANPWAPQHPESCRSCLHTVLEEEWEHLRYALRDLDAIERGAGA